MACPRTMSTLSEAPPTVIRSTWPHRFESSSGGDSSLSSDCDFLVEVSYEDDNCEEPEDIFSGNLRDLGLDNAADMDKVDIADVHSMLEHFSKNVYRSRNVCPKATNVLHHCLSLFSKDYHYFSINNDDGKITSTYPLKMVVLEYEKTSLLGMPTKPVRSHVKSGDDSDSMYESLYDVSKVQEMCHKACLARCRSRFPVPVILLEGRQICRSGTLSSFPELYAKSLINYTSDKVSGAARCDSSEEEEEDNPIPPTDSQWVLFGKLRSHDIKLLKVHGVTSICDLMVEKKKVKFGLNCTSSEKVDKGNRYASFKILSMPYPGCEFFNDFSKNGYNGVGLRYDWTQNFVNAILDIPDDDLSNKLDIIWKSYKIWDLITLTKNYFKLLLNYLANGEGGLLIHCISGWDRTPLFISLLRLSLWADGLVHKSLSPVEILYLTLGYDWFLFGHNLPDRMEKGEEILFFCFDFLKYITGEEFSIRKNRHRSPRSTDGDAGPVDDLLFEPGVSGSNTSLNSSSSHEGAPMVFHVFGNDPASPESPPPPQPPLLSYSNEGASMSRTTCHRPEGAVPLRPTTTPVAVPCRSAKRPDSALSFTCGSWQLVSGTGSVRGSTSARESLSSPTPSSDHSSKSGSNNRTDSEGDKPSASSSSSRWRGANVRSRRLGAVRKHFFDAYMNAAAHRFKNGTEASRFAGFFDQFAEKVGIWTASRRTQQ